MLDLIWVILDHLRCVTVSVNLFLKLQLDRIYSSGDIAIFNFSCFSLKLPIAPLLKSSGSFEDMLSPNEVPLNDFINQPNPQKGPSLRGNTWFEP